MTTGLVRGKVCGHDVEGLEGRFAEMYVALALKSIDFSRSVVRDSDPIVGLSERSSKVTQEHTNLPLIPQNETRQDEMTICTDVNPV